MRLAWVVVVLGAGCGKSANAPSDAASDPPGTIDASASLDGALVLDAPLAVDAASPGDDGPPAAPVCTVTRIEAPGNTFSVGNAIDGAGNVAGSFVAADGGTHAFRWHASTGFVDLGTLGGGAASAFGISGEITVGTVTVGPDDSFPFLSDASGMHALAMPAGAHRGRALGVNASGIAVGEVTLADGFRHAVKYQDGMAIDLGADTGRWNSTAFAISDSGVIVGSAEDNGLHDRIAVMWVNGTVTSLGPGTAAAVNAAGDVVVGDLAAYHGGTTTPLALPSGVGLGPFLSGAVSGVNDAGWIVGYVHGQALEDDGVDHPTLYIDGVVWDMNRLVPAPAFSWRGRAINNAGQIVANVGAARLITCTRP